MTPLEKDIRQRIAAAGPMPVAEFMALCLTDPQHGYYVTREPIGAAGDFTTAPEVSQMFGELIGVWMVAVWQQMGSPSDVRIIELGPGRGTLITDALRAARVAPDFSRATVLHLVEISPPLQAQQEAALKEIGAPTFWHKSLAEVPAGPSIIVANEFFDALPINQAVKMADGWHTRAVTIGPDDALAFGVAAEPLPRFELTLPRAVQETHDGSIFEWRTDTEVMELGRRLSREPGAALVIDYGHAESAAGDTLQAMRDHMFAEPLSDPGTADLTAHVDFEALMHAGECMGARAIGPIDQSELLRRLGIATRASVLKANASHAKSAEIDVALARLTGRGRTGMGSLFKAVAFTHPRLGAPPGFES